MRKSIPIPFGRSPSRRRGPYSFAGLVCYSILASSCAALTNPGVQGIPVRLLPPELRGKSVEGLRPIPLALLGQARSAEYRIDAGDVLGVWVEGVLGELKQ